MGHATLNIEKDTVLISQSQQKSLFTSNQEEADTRIAMHCSESSKPVFVKSKDTDILNLMVYPFAITSPPYDWCLQTDNNKIFSIKKIIKILEKQLVCVYLSFILLLAVTYQKRVFERLLKDISPAHLIEKIAELVTVSENSTYQVTSFSQKYIYRGKTNEELVDRLSSQTHTA